MKKITQSLPVSAILLTVFFSGALFGVERGSASAKTSAPTNPGSNVQPKAKPNQPKAKPKVKPKKLIFLHFYNQAAVKNVQSAENLEWVESSIGKAIHKSIQNKFRYEKVADAKWQSYMTQNRWQKKDLYDLTKLRKMGLDFGADGIVYGKFSVRSQADGDYLEATGSILSVIDGDVIATHTLNEKIDPRIFQQVEQLAINLGKKIKSLFVPSNTGALRRSAILPGWGQYYKQRKTAAYIWGGTFIAASGFLVFSSIKYWQSKNEFDSFDPGTVTTTDGETAFTEGESAARREFKNLERNNARWETITWVSAALVGTVYLLNLADAWFFHGDYGQLSPAATENEVGFYLNGGFGPPSQSHQISLASPHRGTRASKISYFAQMHFEARFERRF